MCFADLLRAGCDPEDGGRLPEADEAIVMLKRIMTVFIAVMLLVPLGTDRTERQPPFRLSFNVIQSFLTLKPGPLIDVKRQPQDVVTL